MLKSYKKGFTLIELLVVIAIIGLLSTLAVFSLNSARTKARDAKRISDMKMLSTAMEMYATDEGSYDDAITSCESGLYTCSGISYGGAPLLDLVTLKDPSNPTILCNGELVPCEYTFFSNPAVWDWSVCFGLEKPTGNQGSGLHAIGPGGSIVSVDDNNIDDYCRDE
ncbi:MAG: prepilin-type N-terminal cleavage/methylation domain-containing protein [Patescibacteria group bacterium]|nr:prepilin-type N-terminal cleavage/methylation domain-containing protein [Patescibacteria group bacterium]MDD4304217.1 prepilin-type N-terminal cleavage/methylation domain-containing protein [Patescibacteria group bacterium]MDD4695250.1 prepilin-type N-terminal cleavage/methylation domain-containing protein [Patescibacteria group bacterium]